MPRMAMPSALKIGKFRSRFFTKRKQHIPSASNEAALACERGASEEIVQSDGGMVPWESGVEDEIEGGDIVESPEEFIRWLCGNEGQQDEVKDEDVKEGETRFRCDIFPASGQDFVEAEKECKQLVIEAGGTIATETEYLGGFMYTLPKDFSGPPPLETSDETLHGGYIQITPVDSSATLEPVEQDLIGGIIPAIDQVQIKSAIDQEHSGDQLTIPTVAAHPVSPLTIPATTAISTDFGPISPLSVQPQESAITMVSSESKEWPRPKDGSLAKRTGDWVKVKAAKHKAKIDEDVRAGVDKEAVRGSEYEGGVETGALYMDGYNDLAVWMGAGGISRE